MLRNPITAILTTNKSCLTNGRLPAGMDRRSSQARRFRDLMHGYEAEFELAPEIDRRTIRTAAALALKIEDMEAAQLPGVPVDAGNLARLAGQLRRLIADLK